MSQAWTDADRQALLAKWEELRRYRDWVNEHPYGLADPDKHGYDAEHRDVSVNRRWISDIGSIVNLEKDYTSSPKLGPNGTRVWDALISIRRDKSRVADKQRAAQAALEEAREDYVHAKGVEKRKRGAEIKRLPKEIAELQAEYDRYVQYQKDIVDWDLGVAVAMDAGIMAFSKRMTRFEEHDRKFKQAAGFEVRDEHNKVVARATTKEQAYRASRRARSMGGVNRAGGRAVIPDRHESQRSRHRKWTAYILENGYRDEGGMEHRPETVTKREAESQAWRTMADEDAYYAQKPRAYEGFDEDLPSDVHGRL